MTTKLFANQITRCKNELVLRLTCIWLTTPDLFFTHFFWRVKFNMCCSVHHRAIFVWPWKIILVSVHYLFYQPVDEKIKTWPLCFPTKENPYMEQTLFNWPNMLQYDIKAKHWLISRKFFSRECSLNQPKATKNQSNCSVPVCLLFLFCSCISISRSYKNCSIILQSQTFIAVFKHLFCSLWDFLAN